MCGETSAAPPAITYLYPAGGQRGTTVEVTAGGTFARWPVQAWTSDKSIVATATKDKGRLSIAMAADAVPGVCWLRLHDEQGASTLRRFIVGTLPDVAEKEPNDEPAKAQPIKLPAVVNGRLDKAGDVDVFSVALKKGEMLVASVDAHRSLKSPMDGVLQILTPDGFVLEQNNDWHGLDPQVIFNVPKDGTYLVRLFAFPAVADASIRLSGGETFIYRLTLTTGGFADFPLQLAVERKNAKSLEIRGWNIPAEVRNLPFTPREDTVTLFHPLLANPLSVRVEDHPCFEEIVAPRAKEPRAAPFSVTAYLAKPGDANTCQVTAKKGQALTIRVESRDLGLPVNPVIRVLDATGKQFARADPANINKDAELAFNPPADGIYAIEVRDLHSGGGPRFVYRLRVALPEPDFELTIAADRFALAPGKPLNIPVTITRRGGLAKEIEVTAEGLPAGVAAAVVPPMGKADLNKVTLCLTTDKPGPSGAFRIVGRSKEPALSRAAKAQLADFETTTSDLWLAVGGEVPAAVPKKKK